VGDDLVAGPEGGEDDARIDVYGEGQSDDGPRLTRTSTGMATATITTTRSTV
jgi:hypothetical protein